MALHLTVILDDLVDRVTDPRVQKAIAEALEDTMKDGTARFIGADLRLSGFKGAPVEFAADFTAGTGIVTLPLRGGTYALADKGRRRAKRVIRSRRRRRSRKHRRPALSTPWGPRRSVRGSTWTGFHLTDTLGPLAVAKATEAAVAEVLKAAKAA